MTELPLLGTAEFPGDVEHVTEARHWVRRVLGDAHAAVDLVELLACELITNSAKHTKTDNIRIAVYGSGDTAHVQVVDAGSNESTPRSRGDVFGNGDSGNGRGLYLVDTLTEGRWGTYRYGAGQTTWFTVRG
jgi:anti-sigma regulatory factor (Ser/Thr protein kinase)